MTSKDKKILLIGSLLTFGLLLKAKGNTVKSSFVDILNSIKRTFVNEGVWYKEPTGGSKDKGDYYPQTGTNRIFYGTNYGVTAAFLVENFNKLNIPLVDKNVIKNLTEQQARQIFMTVVGGRMRYNEFKNQYLADFVFDWMVQRPSTCIAYMTENIFGFSKAEKVTEIDREFYSNRLLNLINSSDPEKLYNSLKYWRLYHLTYTDTYMSFRKGVYNRIVKYKDYTNSVDVEKMIKEAYKKAFGV